MRIKLLRTPFQNVKVYIEWLDKNVGAQSYYLHTHTGGPGWKYFVRERIIEIQDERLATLFLLIFGQQAVE